MKSSGFCEDCKWWQHGDSGGVCQKGVLAPIIMGIRISNFGCSLWEKRMKGDSFYIDNSGQWGTPGDAHMTGNVKGNKYRNVLFNSSEDLDISLGLWYNVVILNGREVQ